ncbi:MAG: zinc-dependent metalloprotease [Nocardioidaceae bacterium]
MADLPRDDSPGDGEDRSPQNPFAGTPFEQVFAGLASGDMSGLQAMFGQLQRMFAPHEGAVNWDVARDLARSIVAQQSDRSPDAGDISRLQDTAQLAQHWLDQVTDIPASSGAVAAWSRAQWVETSMPLWQELVEPIAESVVKAIGEAIPAEAQAMAGPMLGILTQVGGAMFSQQVGQAVGALADGVVSATDLGIPVASDGVPAVVVGNAASFAEGLGIDESDVLLYLVLRECAHQRLYAHSPWLREHVVSAVREYGRGITIDAAGIEEKMRTLDPSDMAAMQEAMTGGLFDLERTPAQEAALTRLETALALVEGWVDDVVGQATEKAMPNASALREAVRRRRATGGPAEATFAALVGLELRPRRLRDAAALWGALRAAEGAAARDGVWSHPDLLPGPADLDDPLTFAERAKAGRVDTESAEFDAALTALLDEASAEPRDGGASGDAAEESDNGPDEGEGDQGRQA